MRKTKIYPEMEPWVLCPKGEKPMNAFDPDQVHGAWAQPTPNQMWAVIDEALDRMSNGALKEVEAVLT
jgi:hypothetical protein